MATLQKFKLLATQCAVAGSPTRSPSASPVIHLRRRKTLRMLLNRSDRRHSEIDNGRDKDPPKKTTNSARKDARVRRKLKDLFVSSPPPVENRIADDEGREEEEEESPELGLGFRFLPASNGSVSFGGGFGIGWVSARRRASSGAGAGAGSLRAVTSSGFRYRFFRRAWRPVLVSIPE